MKRLRNISIYYIIFGVLCAFSYVAFQLWRILIPGAILFVLFLILRFIFRIKTLPPKLTKKQSLYISVFLYALPILFTIWVNWYTERPFRQTIIVPENYEGVVAIQYGQEGGQRQWTGGFLGIGASRLIKVDTFGIAFTKFEYHKTDIEFLYISPPKNNHGLEIFFKNDLKNEIPYKEYPKSINYKNNFEINVEKGFPVAYMTGFDSPPLIVFVVTKPSNYYKYFMTEEEMIEDYRNEHKKAPPYQDYFSLNNIRLLKPQFRIYDQLE